MATSGEVELPGMTTPAEPLTPQPLMGDGASSSPRVKSSHRGSKSHHRGSRHHKKKKKHRARGDDEGADDDDAAAAAAASPRHKRKSIKLAKSTGDVPPHKASPHKKSRRKKSRHHRGASDGGASRASGVASPGSRVAQLMTPEGKVRRASVVTVGPVEAPADPLKMQRVGLLVVSAMTCVMGLSLLCVAATNLETAFMNPGLSYMFVLMGVVLMVMPGMAVYIHKLAFPDDKGKWLGFYLLGSLVGLLISAVLAIVALTLDFVDVQRDAENEFGSMSASERADWDNDPDELADETLRNADENGVVTVITCLVLVVQVWITYSYRAEILAGLAEEELERKKKDERLQRLRDRRMTVMSGDKSKIRADMMVARQHARRASAMLQSQRRSDPSAKLQEELALQDRQKHIDSQRRKHGFNLAQPSEQA